MKQTLIRLKRETALKTGDFNMLLSIIDERLKQNISMETEDSNISTNQSSLLTNHHRQTYTEHTIQQQQNAHVFQGHMEHSPGCAGLQNTQKMNF